MFSDPDDVNCVSIESDGRVLIEQLSSNEVEVSHCSVWFDTGWVVAEGDDGDIRAVIARQEPYLKRRSIMLERLSAAMSQDQVAICLALLTCDRLPVGWAEQVRLILLNSPFVEAAEKGLLNRLD